MPHTFFGGEALGVRLRTGGAALSCRLYRTNKNGDHSEGGGKPPHSKAPFGRTFCKNYAALGGTPRPKGRALLRKGTLKRRIHQNGRDHVNRGLYSPL
jgi:hypothetical protein